jgi:hypothetical protein
LRFADPTNFLSADASASNNSNISMALAAFPRQMSIKITPNVGEASASNRSNPVMGGLSGLIFHTDPTQAQ